MFDLKQLLDYFEIYSVFSFIFGNLDFINASLSLVFGLLCLIISFQLLTKSQKQKTYLFSTNLSCLLVFSCLFIDFLEELDKDKIILSILLGLGLSIAIGYTYQKFCKIPKSNFYFVNDKYKNSMSINEVEKDLKLKTTTFYSYLIQFAILNQKDGYLIVFETFNFFSWSFFDPFFKYKSPNEDVCLNKFVNKISPSRLLLFLAGELPKSEVKISNIFLAKKLFFKIKARSIILKRRKIR